MQFGDLVACKIDVRILGRHRFGSGLDSLAFRAVGQRS
jgi:hypothetical protein